MTKKQFWKNEFEAGFAPFGPMLQDRHVIRCPRHQTRAPSNIASLLGNRPDVNRPHQTLSCKLIPP